jgi:hypothetical protein
LLLFILSRDTTSYFGPWRSNMFIERPSMPT